MSPTNGFEMACQFHRRHRQHTPCLLLIRGKNLSVEVTHRDGRGKRERMTSTTVEALGILENEGTAGLAYNSSNQMYLIRGSAALLPLQKDSSTPLQSSGLYGFSITAAVESSSRHMLRLKRSEVDYLLPIDDGGMLASLFHELKMHKEHNLNEHIFHPIRTYKSQQANSDIFMTDN